MSFHNNKKHWLPDGLATLLILLVASTSYAYVLPQMGGGSVGEAIAPMKHADISLSGGSLHVAIDASIATPVLRPLTPPDEFDPTKPWSVLTGTSHNYQYGWNPQGFFNIPFTAWIWMEQTDASPGLEVYQRPPAEGPTYAPIFGTNGSSTLWRWTGAMTHNVYAVANPSESSYFASYRVYVGDAVGTALAGYGEANTTFHFAAEIPLMGDYNSDGEVTSVDYAMWASEFGQTGGELAADGNGDGTVNAADYTLWRDAMTASAVAVPEPGAVGWLAFVFVAGNLRRRCIDAL